MTMVTIMIVWEDLSFSFPSSSFFFFIISFHASIVVLAFAQFPTDDDAVTT